MYLLVDGLDWTQYSGRVRLCLAGIENGRGLNWMDRRGTWGEGAGGRAGACSWRVLAVATLSDSTIQRHGAGAGADDWWRQVCCRAGPEANT